MGFVGMTGLIETWDVLKLICVLMVLLLCIGLIETWDVLKYFLLSRLCCRMERLIETWDVLKYALINGIARAITINRNMRCIEIEAIGNMAVAFIGLIETWDVLK